MENEFELLRKLRFGSIAEQELLDIYYRYRDSYQVLFHLVQHPKFPERFSLNIIPDLFSMDLLRVIKNMRTRPYVRKRAELEFTNRYNKFPMGEKLSYIRIAPYSLLNYFIEEKDARILKVILNNVQCTEELVVKFINRKNPRFAFYEALDSTEWYKRPQIAELVARDGQAPIKLMLKIVPYLSLDTLKAVYKREDIHRIVKRNIVSYLKQKKI